MINNLITKKQFDFNIEPQRHTITRHSLIPYPKSHKMVTPTDTTQRNFDLNVRPPRHNIVGYSIIRFLKSNIRLTRTNTTQSRDNLTSMSHYSVTIFLSILYTSILSKGPVSFNAGYRGGVKF